MIARHPVVIPLLTSLVERVFISNSVGDLGLPLYELHTQTLTGMEGDVAMHNPNSGVVGRKSDDKMTASGKCGGIATGRIGEV
jgi:hypothetical protein